MRAAVELVAAGEVEHEDQLDHRSLAAQALHLGRDHVAELAATLLGGAQVAIGVERARQHEIEEREHDAVVAAELLAHRLGRDTRALGDLFDPDPVETALQRELDGGAHEAVAQIGLRVFRPVDGLGIPLDLPAVLAANANASGHVSIISRPATSD